MLEQLEPMLEQLEPMLEQLEPMLEQLEPMLERLEPIFHWQNILIPYAHSSETEFPVRPGYLARKHPSVSGASCQSWHFGFRALLAF